MASGNVARIQPAGQGHGDRCGCCTRHRLNYQAINATYAERKAQGRPLRPRARRALEAIALRAGQNAIRLRPGELANWIQASKRTAHRAVADLRDAALLDYEAGRYSGAGGRGVPVRQAPLVQLGIGFRAIALGGAPSAAQIRSRGLARLGSAFARPAGRRSATSSSGSVSTPGLCRDVLTLTAASSGPGPPRARAHPPPCTCAACWIWTD